MRHYISEITTPEKKSKAIPIVRPDEIEKENNDKEQAIRVGRDAVSSLAFSVADTATRTLVAVSRHRSAIGEENNPVERTGTPVSEADTWTLFDAKRDAENTSQPGYTVLLTELLDP
jgi:hypothetical protein